MLRPAHLISLLLVLLLVACAQARAGPARPTAPPLPSLASTPLQVPTVTPGSPPGSAEHPLILALPPARTPRSDQITQARKLADLLSEKTGYRVLAVAPFSYPELIEALRQGKVHLAALPPVAMVQAYQREAIRAFYASTRQGAASYGAQFLAHRHRFTSYFDPINQQNTAPATIALEQFAGQKPCWTEPTSFSGYLVPFGLLNWYRIPTQEGAFVQSHYDVVRALQLEGICDFGATYVDARRYPALREAYPDLFDEIIVVWQIPPVIPYTGLFLSAQVPEEVASNLRNAIHLILPLEEGKAALQTLYSLEDLIAVEDLFYVEFRRYLEASGANLDDLLQTLELTPTR